MHFGPDGKLYIAVGENANSSNSQTLGYTVNQAPQITAHPADRTVAVGQSATFTVSASGTAPLQYQWRRNGANIAGATGTSYTLPSAALSDNGATFDVVVTNSFGTATSNAATLTVTANSAPSAVITSPANNTLYSGGDSFTYSGTTGGSFTGLAKEVVPASQLTH